MPCTTMIANNAPRFHNPVMNCDEHIHHIRCDDYTPDDYTMPKLAVPKSGCCRKTVGAPHKFLFHMSTPHVEL